MGYGRPTPLGPSKTVKKRGSPCLADLRARTVARARDFARAVGRLAKTDRIDAGVLAHFAKAVHPEPRPLADEYARELHALVLRSRQILDMITAEGNRARTASKAVKRRIEAHLRWLRKELERANEDLARAVRESPVWREKDDLLRSIPGVGPTLSSALLAFLIRMVRGTAARALVYPGKVRERRVRGKGPSDEDGDGAGGVGGDDAKRGRAHGRPGRSTERERRRGFRVPVGG